MRTQLSLPKKGAEPPIFGPCLLCPNGRPSQLLLSTCVHLYRICAFIVIRWSIFGRPFVCKTVRPMLSDHVCPVCNVSVLWPNGWMNQDETWHAGRPRPWPHCVIRGSSSPRKGDTAAPPLFGPCLLWPRSPSLATAELLFAQLTAQCPYTLEWAAFLPSKLPLPMGRSGIPLGVSPLEFHQDL